MNVANQIRLNKQLKAYVRKLLGLCGVLIACNVVLTAIIFRQDLKVILVPTHLNKEIIITAGEVSEEYLEVITRDYIGLILNITPENYEYAEAAVLKHTHPSSYGAIKQELSELSKDIKSRNVAINFFTTDMVVDKKNLGVDVNGYLETKIGLTSISRVLHKYRITYDFTGSMLTLKDFYEVKDEGSL